MAKFPSGNDPLKTKVRAVTSSRSYNKSDDPAQYVARMIGDGIVEAFKKKGIDLNKVLKESEERAEEEKRLKVKNDPKGFFRRRGEGFRIEGLIKMKK